MSKPCKSCGSNAGWYTSYSGGFAHPVPCEWCNPKGMPREAFARDAKARGEVA